MNPYPWLTSGLEGKAWRWRIIEIHVWTLVRRGIVAHSKWLTWTIWQLLLKYTWKCLGKWTISTSPASFYLFSLTGWIFTTCTCENTIQTSLGAQSRIIIQTLDEINSICSCVFFHKSTMRSPRAESLAILIQLNRWNYFQSFLISTTPAHFTCLFLSSSTSAVLMV